MSLLNVLAAFLPQQAQVLQSLKCLSALSERFANLCLKMQASLIWSLNGIHTVLYVESVPVL